MKLNTAQKLATVRSISEIGNSLRFIGFPLALLSIRGRAQDVALADVLEQIGFIGAGLIAPAFLDRVGRFKLLVGVDTLSAVVSLMVIYFYQQQSLAGLLFCAALMTSLAVCHENALNAFVAEASQETQNNPGITRVIGFSRMQLAILLGGVIGSSIGTAIVSYGIPILILGDALSFLAAAGILFGVKESARLTSSQTPGSLKESILEHVFSAWNDWKEGFRLARSNPATRRGIMSQSIVALAHGFSSPVIISHYRLTLGATERQIGIAQVNNRLWQFAGALVSLHSRLSLRARMSIGATLMTIGYATMSVAPFWILLVGYGIQQFGNSLLTPANRSLCFEGVPSTHLARIGAFRGLAIDVAITIANIVAYFLLASFPTHLVFVISSVLMIVVLFSSSIAASGETTRSIRR